MSQYAGKRIVVAMSGGVDSSVTAALLQEQGAEVIGMTMQIWDYSAYAENHPDACGSCCSPDDVHDARRVAERLAIPFYVVNFEDAFQREVIDRFRADYLAGRTPNPCVLCNQILKFELLLRRARELNADYLATGHYARIDGEGDTLALRRGLDENKDQSYFLFPMTREQLPFVLFPLGAMTKSEVRNHAVRCGLRVAEKAESQDICFVPDGDYVRFLEEHEDLSRLGGDIVHVDGTIVGRHNGFYRYTIGQRKGLGISWREPLHVIGIDAARCRVIVGERRYLDTMACTVDRVNWLIDVPQETLSCTCQIRYRHAGAEAELLPLDDGKVKVRFAVAQQGVTPGQAAVFYADDRVLGGGWIA
ncbi:MAG: tRNA 2-thiouridine(34) synthase MnmA [Desulfuromonadaceae bacterium]|nr:tRNA 2-thiouridine(34) synthase MnmA [Desulfuromonadaceae bacterium]